MKLDYSEEITGECSGYVWCRELKKTSKRGILIGKIIKVTQDRKDVVKSEEFIAKNNLQM